MAAKAGARQVFAIDNPAAGDFLQLTREVVQNSPYADRIVIIAGHIDRIQLPVDKVDVIISNWMGDCLLHRCLLPAIIVARDRWLRDGGTIFPDHATLYIAGSSHRLIRDTVQRFWRQVYGFDMSSVIPFAMCDARQMSISLQHVSVTFSTPHSSFWCLTSYFPLIIR